MLAEEAVKAALASGVEEAEAFELFTREISIQVEKGRVKTASSVRFLGLGVRAAIGRKLGFAFATNPANGVEVGREAADNARAAPEDPNFRGLPEARKVEYLEGLMDPKLRDLELSEAVDLFLTAVDSARLSDKIVSISGKLEISFSKVSILSSKGVDVSEERTYLNAFIEAASKDGDRRGSGFGFTDSRKLDMFDPEKVGKEAGEMAIKTLDATTIGVEELPVIFQPKAQFTIIPFIVGAAANAENLQYGRSFLTNRLGDKIAREEISIVDDGRIPWLSGSSSFDAEGIPTKRTYVVEKGVFKSPIHNWYTASKEGVDTTGNASRDHTSLPSISPHTTSLEAPKLEMKMEELLEVKRGVLVVYTGDRPNLATGEFSGMAETAFLIENGEITKSLRQTGMGFRLEDLLKSIDGVGDDVETVAGFKGGSIRAKIKVAGPGS